MRLSHRIAAVVLALIVGMTSLTLTVIPTAAATSPFSDIGGSSFRDEIEWLAAEGITSGCGAGRFCPERLVTRGQMASFLTRMFDLAPSTTDRFDDDERAATRRPSTRSPLPESRPAAPPRPTVRGGSSLGPKWPRSSSELPTSALRSRIILDDERSSHEPNINRMALAGVTGGSGSIGSAPVGCSREARWRHFCTGSRIRSSAPAALPARPALPACRYGDVLDLTAAPCRLADQPARHDLPGAGGVPPTDLAAGVGPAARTGAIASAAWPSQTSPRSCQPRVGWAADPDRVGLPQPRISGGDPRPLGCAGRRGSRAPAQCTTGPFRAPAGHDARRHARRRRRAMGIRGLGLRTPPERGCATTRGATASS